MTDQRAKVACPACRGRGWRTCVEPGRPFIDWWRCERCEGRREVEVKAPSSKRQE